MPHSLYEMVTKKAEETAKKHDVRLVIKAPNEANLEQQIRIMDTLIKQGVDGIAINPVDPEVLTPVINKAVDAGIDVICFESDAPDSKRLAYIGSDNRKSGELMGKALDKLLNGESMILIETGMRDMLSMRQRLKGLLQYLNQNTDIQVLEVRYHEGSDQKALADMEEMIDEHPHFDAMVLLDPVSSSHSILLWKAKGLNRYALTFGMTPEIKEAMHNGQITAAVSQREYEWGRMIVQLLLKAREEKVASFYDTGTILYRNREEVANLNLD